MLKQNNINKKIVFWKNFFKKIKNFKIVIIIMLVFIILLISITWTCIISNKIIVSGGSTSVSIILDKITQQFYKDNNIDILYNSLGSAAAKLWVENKNYVFGIFSKDINLISKNGDDGWSAQKFWNKSNINCFVFARDYIVLVHYLPKNCYLTNNKPLYFNSFFGGLGTQKIKNIYSHKLSWQTAFPQQISCSQINSSFYKITRESGSGTRDFFEKNIIKSKIYSIDRVVSSNGDMYQAIISTPGSIGYLSFSYLKQIAQNAKLGLKSIFGVLNQKGNIEFPFKVNNLGKSIIDTQTGEYVFNNNYPLTRPFIGIVNVKHYHFPKVLKFIKWMLDPTPYYQKKNKIKNLSPSDAAYWYLKEGVQPLTKNDPYFIKYNNNTNYAISKYGFNKNYKSIWELTKL